MSEFAPNLPPHQMFRSPLGTSPGTPGPLGIGVPDAPPAPGLAVEHAPLPDVGAPQQPVPMFHQHPVDSESDLLKAMLTFAHDYKALPTVTEQERLQMEQATTILQRLLASNEKLGDQATGGSPAMRKLFA